MRKVLATSIALASLTTAAQANVFLPNIGIDGWNNDGLLAKGAALNQGYLTLAHDRNHIINPAYSLDLQDSAQANLGSTDSGGVWTEVFGHQMGLYLGRPTGDSFMYMADTGGNGNLDSTLASFDARAGAPTSLFDLYWADNLEAGDLGLRLNMRARSVSDELQVNNDDVENTKSGGLYQMFLTAGFVSRYMPVEATVHLGLPFGGYNQTIVDDNAGTETVNELGYDSGLRWGATVKYTLSESQTSRTLVSGFIGGAGSTFNITSEEVENDNQLLDDLHLQTRSTLGVIGSHERMINNRTRLVASAGLTRSSSKIGYEDQLEGSESEDFVESAQYNLPFAVGFEFSSSERTQWSASISDTLFTRSSTSTHAWNGTDEKAEVTTETATHWGSSNTSIQVGVNRELIERLHGQFVLNKELVDNTFSSGIATQATLSYEF